MEVIDFLLLLISIVYLMLTAYLYRISIRKYIDVMNPMAMLSIFAALDALSLLWFAANPDHREILIYSQISSAQHKTDNIVALSYVLSIVSYVVTAAALFFILPKKYIDFSLNGTRPETIRLNDYGLLLWMIGIALTLYLMMSFGGLQELWLSYMLVGKAPEGLGYVNLISNGFICIGGALIYQRLSVKREYLKLSLMIVISTLVLSIFGNRSPILIFAMMIIFTYHYKINRIKKILNKTTIGVGVAFLVISLFLVGLRPGSDSSLVGENASIDMKFARDIVMRVGTLERKMVVIGYFDINNIWYGRSYYSLITSPIPRSIFGEKPPVDTGVYIKEIADGGSPKVNSDISTLPDTSWPDGSLAGWMNFHFVGFVFLSVMTGLIYGWAYKYFRRNGFKFSHIYIYITLCYWGAPNLSPLGIVRLMSAFGLLIVVNSMFSLIHRRRYLV